MKKHKQLIRRTHFYLASDIFMSYYVKNISLYAASDMFMLLTSFTPGDKVLI